MIPGHVFRTAPSRTGIDEEDALYLFGNGIPVFDCTGVHLVAAEFVIFIAAQCISTAEGKDRLVRHIACSNTTHETYGNNMGMTYLVVETIFYSKFVVVEIAA